MLDKISTGGSAALGGELLFDQGNEVADGVHGFELGGLELDFQAGLDGDDEVDVVEGIPLGEAGGGEVGGEDEGVVVEDVVEDGGELSVDFGLLHEGSVYGLGVAFSREIGKVWGEVSWWQILRLAALRSLRTTGLLRRRRFEKQILRCAKDDNQKSS